MDNENEKIRVNALLGSSYLARIFKELDSNKAIEILKKHCKFTGNSLDVAECAIDDIKLFTGVDMSGIL